MFDGRVDHYHNVAQSAARCVVSALLAAEVGSPARVLDLPCGHGRVLRALKAIFPEAEYTASDIDRDGVDYCARELGAIPVYSSKDIDSVALPGTYDLIWCGSLVTHLDVPGWLQVFRLFSRALSVNGVAVMSFHGRWVAHAMREIYQYGLSLDRVESVLASYAKSGFGYVDYEGVCGYGVSVASPGWLIQGMMPWTNLRMISLCEKQWDNHQDVIAIQRWF